jgi:hypothetical protein
MIKTFDTFQPSIETFLKKVGLVGENHGMEDLFGDRSADVVIEITPNYFSTYQVLNRLPGASFIPKYVSNRMHARNLNIPVTVVSPLSEIRTFTTNRQINSQPIQKGSLYFSRPNITDQYQVAIHEGRIIGVRQIIDGKAVHLNINRHPIVKDLQVIAESMYSALNTDLMRVRIGTTKKRGQVFMAMENFKLQKPEMTQLYFSIYENFIGHMPEWFKHHIESSMIIPYLNEYINREEMSKKCPYLL